MLQVVTLRMKMYLSFFMQHRKKLRKTNHKLTWKFGKYIQTVKALFVQDPKAISETKWIYTPSRISTNYSKGHERC